MDINPAITPADALTPTDTDALLRVWEAAVRSTHPFLTETDIAFYRPIVREALPQVELYVVHDTQHRPVAFMGLGPEQIEMLFVHPAAQGKGIGRRCLQYARQQKGLRRVDVNEQNPAGRAFYRHLGFRVVGRSETDGFGRPFPILHLEAD